MGYAFTYPLIKLFTNSKIICYVHYPTISTDMLKIVKKRTTTFNNNQKISNSRFFSFLKLW